MHRDMVEVFTYLDTNNDQLESLVMESDLQTAIYSFGRYGGKLCFRSVYRGLSSNRALIVTFRPSGDFPHSAPFLG